MKNCYNFLLILILISIVSCGRRYVKESYYTRPKHDKFSFKEFRLMDNNLIDTNAVYEFSTYSGFRLKFYGDGRVFFCANEEKPMQLVEERVFGYVGYYKVEGTKLSVELFYTQKHNIWDYLVLRGDIIGDTLRFYKDQYRGDWLGRRNIHHFTQGNYWREKFFVKTKLTSVPKMPKW